VRAAVPGASVPGFQSGLLLVPPDAVRVSGGAATSSPALFGVVRTIGGSSWEGVGSITMAIVSPSSKTGKQEAMGDRAIAPQ